jgi:YolD-like protein
VIYIIDRGLKKWQPSIMPERKGMYDKVFKDDLKLKNPILDESQLHSINDGLVQSIMDETEIVLTLWLDGSIEDIKPVIVRKIDPYQRKIVVQYKNGQQSFCFESIINAQTL